MLGSPTPAESPSPFSEPVGVVWSPSAVRRGRSPFGKLMLFFCSAATLILAAVAFAVWLESAQDAATSDVGWGLLLASLWALLLLFLFAIAAAVVSSRNASRRTLLLKQQFPQATVMSGSFTYAGRREFLRLWHATSDAVSTDRRRHRYSPQIGGSFTLVVRPEGLEFWANDGSRSRHLCSIETKSIPYLELISTKSGNRYLPGFAIHLIHGPETFVLSMIPGKDNGLSALTAEPHIARELLSSLGRTLNDTDIR